MEKLYIHIIFFSGKQIELKSGMVAAGFQLKCYNLDFGVSGWLPGLEKL